MPEAFEKCRKAGGRIRTVSGPSKHWKLKADEYCKVCWKGGKPARGHTKTKAVTRAIREAK